MKSLKLNYTLIGQHPELDDQKDNLQAQIDFFVKWAAVPRPELEMIAKLEIGLLSPLDRVELVASLMADKELFPGLEAGAFIEAAAGHFYGIDANDYDDTFSVIHAMQAFDDELRCK